MKITMYVTVITIIVSITLFVISNKTHSTNNIIDKHIIIDDSVIEKGDINKIIEPLWYSISIYNGETLYLNSLSNYSIQQKYIFAIEWYAYEVNNGGHEQFYYNSTGIVWEDAMKGFKETGLNKAFNIIKESANLLGGYPNKDRDKRIKQLDSLKPNFSNLDDRFYKINDFESVLLEYIKKNRKYFYFNGVVKIPKE